jgi:hypothetical protein
MASEVCGSSAGSSAGQDEALAKLAVMSLSSTTDRAQLWREKGISFRPYRDERDMVRMSPTSAAASLTPTRAHGTFAGCSRGHGGLRLKRTVLHVYIPYVGLGFRV